MKLPNKKSLILCIYCFLILFNGVAQDVEKIELNEEGRLLATLPMGKGIAFVINHKNEIKVINYSDNFSKEWSAKIEQEYKDFTQPVIETITSPSGNYLYTVQIASNGYHNKTHYISKIDSEGKLTQYEIEGRDEFGKELQTIFCNDNNFYYLATDNGNQNHDKKKRDEKLILNTFNKDNFSHSRKLLDLPAVEGEKEIFWEFIGLNDSEFFLASKKVDEEKNISEVNVISFDAKGNKKENFTLNVKLDNAFIRPTRLDKIHARIFSDQANLDYTVNNQSRAIYPTYGGFTGIYFEGNHIYLYGLMGPGKFKKIAAKYEGAYVIKYDLKGNQIWKKELTDNAEMVENKHFNVHATPGLRGLSFIVLPDGTVNVAVNVAGRMSASYYRFIISPDGSNSKVQNVDNIRKNSEFALVSHYDDHKNYGKQFVKTTDVGDERGTVFGNMFYNDLEVLYELNIRDKEIQSIYLLKK
ncbi:hypothetical protein GCM10011506_03320 [Marivirga lumbricoides]|uniref:S9 family peptidase n=1 Tax=Marivirga lumbricoides TaxID=1046115 RepID=A0ABQ1LCS8_9BACT|nr:hypothetical protein GCM10011506_03320 [Marivirga lumbricoides]